MEKKPRGAGSGDAAGKGKIWKQYQETKEEIENRNFRKEMGVRGAGEKYFRSGLRSLSRI